MTGKKALREKQLEILRKRRASKKEAGQSSGVHGTDSDHSGDGNENVDDDDEDKDKDEDGDEDGDQMSGTEEIRRTLIQGNNADYDDDFVVADDDETLGAPDDAALHKIPIEFTQHAHKKGQHHFKDAVEWMVHNKINPAFARNDDIYRIAFLKLADKVQGYSESKFISSVWRSEFIHALKARPEMKFEAYESHGEGKCEACNRSGHLPTFQIQFVGKPYHHDTLESVSDDDSEEADEHGSDEDDEYSCDSKGNSIVGEETKWLVGK